MKNRLILFMAGCLFLSSCFDSDSDVEYVLSKDCEITSFSLSSDSIRVINDVKFTIDQIKGRIYNMDSLPYGTVLNQKFICAMSFAGTVVECKVMQEATGDTILWEKLDSVDFSKPVKIVTKLWDGQTTKGYMAQVNIHKVVPDSMEWSRFAENITQLPIRNEKVLSINDAEGKDSFYMFVESDLPENPYYVFKSTVKDGTDWTQEEVRGLPKGEIVFSQLTTFQNKFYAHSMKGELYTSENGKDWEKVKNTPNICALLGAIETNEQLVTSDQQSVLSVVAENNGVKYFSCLTAQGQWLPTVEGAIQQIPGDFPVKGFANISFYAMYCARLSLIGGETLNGDITNKTWATTNGLTWENISASEASIPFRGIEGASVIEYDNLRGEENKFFMMGGFDENGEASSEIYRSLDGGISWSVSDTLVFMPVQIGPRGEMSVYVNEDNFVYLFGGKENKQAKVKDEIWRGRINRLGFDFVPLK